MTPSTTLDATVEARLRDVARGAARAFARRLGAEAEDLEQQAWLIALEVLAAERARGRVDVERLTAVAYVAVRRQLSRYLRRAWSPVTMSDYRARGDATFTSVEFVSEHDVDAGESPEAQYGRAEAEVVLRAALRRRLTTLFATTPWAAGGAALLPVVVAIYLDGVEPRVAAAAEGVDVVDVYRATDYLRRYVVRSDAELRATLSQLQEARM